jgi:hypothetical protein
MGVYRQPLVSNATRLSAGAPYLERLDHREGRLDAALLKAWGSVAPYLFSGVERRRLDRFVESVETRGEELTALCRSVR